MDAILQLFTAEEILGRLGQKKLTGCFHAFTSSESANILFESGTVVGATKAQADGQLEGEEVIKQILGWKDARYLWQPNSAATPPPGQPLQLNIHEYLAKQKTGASGGETQLAPHKPINRPAASGSVVSIPSKGKSTGPLPEAAPSSGVDLTATKTLTPSDEDRLAHDEALLEKHKLVLVLADDPEKRLKITRVSNLVGRSPACEITIADPSISRQHCLLQLTERGLLVKDMGTTNGTKVNGIMLKEGYINAGDKLTIGHLVFVLTKA